MKTRQTEKPSNLAVVIAFAIVYLVWGSTYFFIQKALHSFPPFTLGAFRFLAAAALLMGWCVFKGEKIWDWEVIKPAAVTGFLLLFVGNGIVIWVEQFIPSGMVAIMVSSSPLWFVILDKPRWKDNLGNKATLLGLFIGFGGVILLFSEQITKALNTIADPREVVAMGLLIVGSMAWAGGSLYSKYMLSGTNAVLNTAWQMASAGIAFIPGAIFTREYNTLDVNSAPPEAWFSVLFLVIFGSIVGYSAYVWLLKVQPATKVSTYAYVNPVVAVLLGVFFANEHVSISQITGFIIILFSVLLINLRQYKRIPDTGSFTSKAT